VYTGLRPGEKLTEELVFDAEETSPTEIPSVHAVTDRVKPDLEELTRSINFLISVASRADNGLILSKVAKVALGEPLEEEEEVFTTFLNTGA